MTMLDNLTSWAVPRSALCLPEHTPQADLLDWFERLGFTDPKPEPLALRWTESGCIEIPVEEADDDDDLILTADEMDSYTPTLADVAAGCVSTVHDHEERFPGPLSWRRWTLTSRVAGLLYTSGLTRSGGSSGWASRDPIGSAVYTLPKLSHVLPHRGTLRPYVLFKRDWWWHCQIAQGWRLRGRHKPEEPFTFGICAACLPCPSCGAKRECLPDCTL